MPRADKTAADDIPAGPQNEQEQRTLGGIGTARGRNESNPSIRPLFVVQAFGTKTLPSLANKRMSGLMMNDVDEYFTQRYGEEGFLEPDAV